MVLVQVATLTAAEAAKLSFIGSCDPTTGPTNFTIEDNDFTMPALPSSLDLDNGHCIALAGVKDAKIVHNRFHYCIYNAIHIEDQSARIWIRDNTITTVGGYAAHWSKNTASIWAMQSRNIVAFKNDLGSARDCGVHLYQTCGVQLLGSP